MRFLIGITSAAGDAKTYLRVLRCLGGDLTQGKALKNVNVIPLKMFNAVVLDFFFF